MRIDELFANAAARGSLPVSFEMFPPKGELTLERAREVGEEFARIAPDFVSVTYSAGGSSNNAATTQIASMLTDELGLASCAHQTCISLRHTDLPAKIDELHQAGIVNVLALRGDVPQGVPTGPGSADYRYAMDIIPAHVEAGFCVGGAAYPEGHIECDDLDRSITHLKMKQDAGASFFVTQLFFDNDFFYRFHERARAAGITVPITAGIMPFMGKQQISRMVFMCGASLPSPVIKLLARFEDDPDSLRAAGIEYACRQLEDLADHGVDGLHIYTMNRPSVASAAMSALRQETR